MSKFVTAAAVVAGASALELTPDNFDAETAGKAVFLKFYAPWCGHCKRMAPQWDALMEEFKDNESVVVANVDCTGEARPLCEAEGIQGFPTLKFGDVSALEDYQGGRDEETLRSFAAGLKAPCGPEMLDNCSEEQKTTLAELMALSEADLDAKLAEKQSAIAEAEATFEKELEGLQAAYEKIVGEKEASIKAVKESGLNLMKSVRALKLADADDDELPEDEATEEAAPTEAEAEAPVEEAEDAAEEAAPAEATEEAAPAEESSAPVEEEL